MKNDEKFYLGAGRSSMKNKDSNWSLYYEIQHKEKYKNSFGVELNLSNNDTTSELLKEIIVEAIKMIDKNEIKEVKSFLIKNFDISTEK